MNTSKLISTVIILSGLFTLQAYNQIIEVQDTIWESTTWNADTVKVTGDVCVWDTATLTISPGTVVAFQGFYKITIRGIFKAMGSISDSITFTIQDTTGFSDHSSQDGGWNGISIVNLLSAEHLTLIRNDSSYIKYCKIEYGKGGVLFFNDGLVQMFEYPNIRISDSYFINCYNDDGAVMYAYFSNALIQNNTFEQLNAYFGALHVRNSNPVIRRNHFCYNTTVSSSVSCIKITNGKPTIDFNFFNNNYTGSVIGSMRSNFILTNNIISNNDDWALNLYQSSPLVLNNSIVNNEKGVFLQENSDLEMINNIIWGNIQGILIAEIECNPSIYHCIIEGGASGITGTYKLDDTSGIFQDDPYFLAPTPGSGSAYPSLKTDWILADSSPAINAGISQTRYSWTNKVDILHNKRILYGHIDIGAIEYQLNKISITSDITESKYIIADTILLLNDIIIQDEIVLGIAPGIRVESLGHNKILVRGTLIARGMEGFPILFTVSDTTGFYLDDTDDGGWGGIMFEKSGSYYDNDSSVLDHCILEYAKSIIERQKGGALYNKGLSRVRLSNSIFINNKANEGGAIFLEDVFGSSVQYCRIENNKALTFGGGIYCSRSTPEIHDNLIVWNSAIFGGGIHLGFSESILYNNLISNNKANNYGGLHIAGSLENEVIFNNLIVNNVSENAVVSFSYSNCKFYNNTIANNLRKGSSYYGAGALIISNSSPIIQNCIIESNGFRQVYIGSISNPEFSNCILQGGVDKISHMDPVLTGIFTNIFDTLAHFRKPSDSSGTVSNGWEADWSILDISPAIDNGKDIGDETIIDYDFLGNPRIYNGQIDIGAIENQGGLPSITVQPANTVLCEGDSVTLFIVTPDTVKISWQKDGIDIPGAAKSELLLDPVTINDEGNYQCIIINSYGQVKSIQVYLIVKQSPDILVQPQEQWLEEGKPHTLSVIAGGTYPLSYQWYKDGSALPGAQIPELGLVPIDSTNEGQYFCIVSNSCGADTSKSAGISIAPNICMVTVSPTTGYNLVVWEKKSKAPIMAYNIYRESVAAGIYDRLATISYDDLSVLVDTMADPTVQAYLYKITALDTASVETDIDLCKPHKTIHLLVTTNPELNTTQLAWDRYYGFDYQTYTIYRSSTGVNFDPVHSMSASLNSWTDPDPLTGDLFYRIAVEKPDPCIPEGGDKKAGTGPYYHSLSNMDDNKLKAGQQPPDTITLSKNSIEEENLPGTMIGKLFTEDKDSLDSHTYKFVPGEGDDDNISFTLMGDLLLASESFDYETKNQYSIRLRSTDESGNYCEVPFIIQIIDIDETTGLPVLNAGAVKAFPNPFSRSTTISFPNPASKSYRMVLTDLSGKVCRITDNITTSVYVLEKQNLKEGFYFIELRGPKIYRGVILIE